MASPKDLPYDPQDRCSRGRCQAEAGTIIAGVGLCDEHYEEYCRLREGRRSLAKIPTHEAVARFTRAEVRSWIVEYRG